MPMLGVHKRINTRCARWGQKHVGSPRFARYYSLRIFARYAGVRRHTACVEYFCTPSVGVKKISKKSAGYDMASFLLDLEK